MVDSTKSPEQKPRMSRLLFLLIPLLGAVVLIFFFQPTKSLTTLTETNTSPTPPPSQEAKWEKPSSDGSLPVGVWSEITTVPPGCSIKFVAGEGFQVEYRFYSKEWKQYQSGTSPDMSELRFKVTVAGKTKAPYVLKCG